MISPTVGGVTEAVAAAAAVATAVVVVVIASLQRPA